MRWVAAEIRYPLVEALAAGIPSDFRESIRERFPIHEEQAEFSLNVGLAVPAPQQLVRQRFLTRDRTLSITVGRDAVILETTDYPGWALFRDLFLETLGALEASVRIDGLLRLGLRYIDEIRVPNPVAAVSDWAHWVDERLLAALTIDADQVPLTGTSVLQYGEPPGYVTVFRASPQPKGRTVQSEGPLRMPYETSDGPYFLLDTDASWSDPQGQVPEFSDERVSEILDDLHTPSNRLFEASITDRLRDEVLRQPREETAG